MMRRTKIVCTIGPATESAAMIRELVQAGMDVARINFSHGSHQVHRRSMEAVRRVADDQNRPVAILADLQGPKLRVGTINGVGLHLLVGGHCTLALPSQASGPDEVPVPHPNLLAALRPGQPVLLDDGAIELVVEEARTDRVTCRVIDGGLLVSRKGINVPQTPLSLPALTEKDRRDAAFAVREGVDLLAISFVSRAEDVLELRRLVEALASEALIVAKIEKPDALEQFDAILAAADGIMVARGDLGVETPAEEVPFHQKRIIRACNLAGKPVITATQMLQSMIAEPRPTRAEASDVANAILDGTDAVMLSGETAVGQHPIAAAKTMARICASADAHLAKQSSTLISSPSRESITGAISRAAVEIADEVGARAIITATESGTTARMVARHRPRVPILAVTPNRCTLHRLGVVWGVAPHLVDAFGDTDRMVRMMVATAREAGLVDRGDALVLTAGVPFGKGRRTNMVRVHRME
jgi:pyruvate kinase